jgi:hypothetical protein
MGKSDGEKRDCCVERFKAEWSTKAHHMFTYCLIFSKDTILTMFMISPL